MLARGLSRPGRALRRSNAGDRDIRQVDRFGLILSNYRFIAILVALSFLAAVATALLLVNRVADRLDPSMILVVAALSALGLVGLITGHRTIRRDLLRSARTMRAIMASVHRDALTGVFTRSYFMEALRNDVHHGSDKSLGYLLLDMDYLKVLNDGAVHAAGECTRQVA